MELAGEAPPWGELRPTSRPSPSPKPLFPTTNYPSKTTPPPPPTPPTRPPPTTTPLITLFPYTTSSDLRDVGRAMDFLMEIRLDEGELGKEAITARLLEWWQSR